MKILNKYIIAAAAIASVSVASAQSRDNDKFAIKVTAERSIGDVIASDFVVNDISSKSSSSELGIEFGWRIWNQKRNVLEANVGVGYASTTLNANMSGIDFHYSAPAAADMDMEPYIRYYELSGLSQKIRTERIAIPLFVNYRYKFSKVFSIHALLGFKFGFNYSSKVIASSGSAKSYGVYPQYDNLLIDAPYMNQFGESEINKENTIKPSVNTFIPAFLTGVGAELRIWGPLAIGASLRYEGSMGNIFKSKNEDIYSFDSTNAPVTYTVADGQKARDLSSYFYDSYMSRISYAVSLIFRF